LDPDPERSLYGPQKKGRIEDFKCFEKLGFIFLEGLTQCKKRLAIIKLFPARESLVKDITAGDGKIANLFYSIEAPPVVHTAFLIFF
jgi:hypothetical protein